MRYVTKCTTYLEIDHHCNARARRASRCSSPPAPRRARAPAASTPHAHEVSLLMLYIIDANRTTDDDGDTTKRLTAGGTELETVGVWRDGARRPKPFEGASRPTAVVSARSADATHDQSTTCRCVVGIASCGCRPQPSLQTNW